MQSDSGSVLLQLQQLEVAHAGIKAVQGIDLEVGHGERVCLIGANGAGKSSTLNAIAGLLPTAAGKILYAGQCINRLPAHRRLRAGIALVPEGRGIFNRLTVEENLRLGAYSRAQRKVVATDLERIHQLLPRLHERRRQLAGTLSGGEQQLLAIGRALLSRPRLLLLDEPSMGLAPIAVDQVFAIIDRIARSGVGILLVEQNARLALEFAQRAYVLDNGRMRLGGSAAQLLINAEVQSAYLGEPPPLAHPLPESPAR